MPDTHTPPFGRIRLDQVIDTWSSLSVLNPRFLASELAALLRTTGPDAQPLGSHAVAVTLFDSATGPGALTIGTLAAYFERYSAGEQPSTVETTVGSARASAVYFDKSWIGRLEIETEARARTAAGLQQMHPAPRPTGGAQPSAQYQPPKSGSDPECLALHQAQQRQEGEHSDAAKLEASEQRALLAERESSKRGAKIQALEHQNQQHIEVIEQITRDFSEERRARTLGDEDRRELIEEIDALQARLTKAETALEQAPAQIAADFVGLSQSLAKTAQWIKTSATGQSENNTRPLLLVIAGLLGLLLDRKRPHYNQGSAAEAIALRGWSGAGERQVNGILAKAKSAATDASADALSKAQGVQQANENSPA